MGSKMPITVKQCREIRWRIEQGESVTLNGDEMTCFWAWVCMEGRTFSFHAVIDGDNATLTKEER